MAKVPSNLRERLVVRWRRVARSPRAWQGFYVTLWLATIFVVLTAAPPGYARLEVAGVLGVMAWGSGWIPHAIAFARRTPKGRCPICSQPAEYHSERELRAHAAATKQMVEQGFSIPCRNCGREVKVFSDVRTTDD